METISQYFNMGGHGGFIWPAYIIVFGVMVALMIVSRRSLKNAQEELKTLETEE